MSLTIHFHSALLGLPIGNPGIVPHVSTVPGAAQTVAAPRLYCSVSDDDEPKGAGGVIRLFQTKTSSQGETPSAKVQRLLGDLRESSGSDSGEVLFQNLQIAGELAEMGSDIVEDLAGAVMMESLPMYVRETSIQVLERIGGLRAALALWMEFAGKEAPTSLKVKAVEATGWMKLPQSVPPLLQVLENESMSRELRIAVVEALGRIGDPGAIPALLSVLKKGTTDKRDSRIKKYAIEAMGKISGLIREKRTYFELTRTDAGIVGKKIETGESKVVFRVNPYARQAIMDVLPHLSEDERLFAMSILNRVPVSAEPTLEDILDDMSLEEVEAVPSDLHRDEANAGKKPPK